MLRGNAYMMPFCPPCDWAMALTGLRIVLLAGFNSVYHFTDVPSFVSGDFLVRLHSLKLNAGMLYYG